MIRAKLLVVSLVLVALVAGAAAAQAGTLTLTTTTGRLGNGGEFHVSGYDDYFLPPAAVVTSIDGPDFNTFCLDPTTLVSLGSTYTYSVDEIVKPGGAALEESTSKLFYTFWKDLWTVSDAPDLGYDLTYDYANSTQRGVDGRDLQYAIWFLQDTVTQAQLDAYVAAHPGSQAQAMVNYALDPDLTWSDLGQGWSGIGSVRVLNLYDPAGAPQQAQIVVVPLPAAALTGLASLALLGAYVGWRRRQRHGLS